MADRDSSTPSDLVARCLAGDQAAWSRLVRRYAPLVRAIPVRCGLTSAEAEDVSQETFLALAQNLHQIEDPERLPGWLATTARRLSWRAASRTRREQPLAHEDLADDGPESVPLPLSTPLPTMTELLSGWMRQEALSAGMSRLPERCRHLLTLIFLDPAEPDYDAIGRTLSMAKGSIGPTRNRCLAQLRQILEGLGFA